MLMLDAASTIIKRDGPGKLTLDAIARESGMSKGAVVHHFRTKEGVLKALMDFQIGYFEEFTSRYLEKLDGASAQPILASQIAVNHQVAIEPQELAFAMLAVIAENPWLHSAARDMAAQKVEEIKREAKDPDLALLRFSAARGLAFSSLLGLCPFSEAERERLFARLADDSLWRE